MTATATQEDTTPIEHPRGGFVTRASSKQGASTGTASGFHITPGSDDDGWIVPPPVRLADQTLVQLYKDGEALHAAYDLIAAARRRVWLEIYIFHSDETGCAFAELLARRARQGLEVRVIYDSIGSSDTDRRLFKTLRTAGVRLSEFHPWAPWRSKHGWRICNRDHRKLLVVDDEAGVLGGQNLGNEYGSSWLLGRKGEEAWRDTAVEVRGPSVRLLSEAFCRMWNYLQLGGPMYRAEFLHSSRTFDDDPTGSLLEGEPAGRIADTQRLDSEPSVLDIPENSMAVLASAPTPRSRLLPNLQKLLRDAETSIELTMAYFAPPEELVEQLCRSAQSGVRVRLVLPGRSDVTLLRIAARAFYEKLMAAGIEIYERQFAVLHAKTLCVDRRLSIVGSANLDYRSIQYNFELSTVIHSRRFGAQMHDLFEHDVQFARRIDPDEWRRRPLRDRLVQWAVMGARYLL